MTGILNILAGALGVAKDTYFNLVSLLLPGNGTNGANNNEFLDSGTANSGSGFTITRNGNTTQGTFSPFSQTGWSAYFDGSNDYVTATLATALTSTYTIDFWINTNSVAAGDKCILNIHTTSSNTVGFVVKRNGSQIQVNDGATGGTGPSGGTLAVGVWKFVTIVCNATNTLLYIDGSLVNTYSGVTLSGSPTFVHIGSFGDLAAGNYADAYISNLRIIVGSAITPSATPPTSPSQSTGSTTKLLTLQSNRFVDNGTDSLTVTPNNGVAITPFSPFAPTQSYSAAAVGGSGYFDGNSDFLQLADNTSLRLGTSAYTVEFWWYPVSSAAAQVFMAKAATGDGAPQAYYAWSTGRFYWYSGTTDIFSTSYTVALNQWYHVAFVRTSTSSNDTRFYINGSLVATSTDATDYTSTAVLNIGGQGGGTFCVNGYLSNFRLVKGTAITPPSGGPTAPLTAITNTSLLLNFTNAGVVDATAKNVLETVGNAQISTTQSKWGGGSISFDGTGDYLLINNNYLPVLSASGDMTIEMWLYPTSTSSLQMLVAMAGGGSTSDFYFYISTGGLIGVETGSGYRDSATSIITANTWQHVALTKSGSTYKIYVGGTERTITGAGTMLTTLTNSALYIGAGNTGANLLTGYIDDLRVSNMLRYNGNFTPPSAPFPVQ